MYIHSSHGVFGERGLPPFPLFAPAPSPNSPSRAQVKATVFGEKGVSVAGAQNLHARKIIADLCYYPSQRPSTSVPHLTRATKESREQRRGFVCGGKEHDDLFAFRPYYVLRIHTILLLRVLCRPPDDPVVSSALLAVARRHIWLGKPQPSPAFFITKNPVSLLFDGNLAIFPR